MEMPIMNSDDERRPEMFESTRQLLADLHADIARELASLEGRQEDLRRQDETARRIHERAAEILGIERPLEPRD